MRSTASVLIIIYLGIDRITEHEKSLKRVKKGFQGVYYLCSDTYIILVIMTVRKGTFELIVRVLRS